MQMLYNNNQNTFFIIRFILQIELKKETHIGCSLSLLPVTYLNARTADLTNFGLVGNLARPI